jgi:hypothetical protein
MPRSAEVDAWMRAYDNPMKPVVQRVREILLAADTRIGECIKWKTPTFTYEGNLASFNPRAKQFASLLFHTGAQIPGSHPLLQGTGDVARYASFPNVAAADAARPALEAIVAAWITSKGGAKKSSASRSSARTTDAKKRGARGTAPKKREATKRRVEKPGAARRKTKKRAAR